MSPDTPRRSRPLLPPILLQALLWTALTVAFAALLVLAGSPSWTNALRFAAVTWMPWVALAPAVFWLAGRFPLERGSLGRAIPIHVAACLLCVAATLTASTYFAFRFRPLRTEDRAGPGIERSAIDHDGEPRPLDGKRDESPRPPPAFHLERPDYFVRGDPRQPFGRRRVFWWPFVGATLLRANFDAAIYLIVAMAAHALAFYRRAQDRERHAIDLAAGLNRAKLDALRLQLQPHFLFNTLNAISTLVHRDAPAADEMINDLGELLRLSLQSVDHEVPLARELELLDRYVAIEKIRLGERLRFQCEIDPAAIDGLVPTFVLQPLVENAIRHGIEPRIAPGTVTVRARRDGSNLVLSVRDDGVGLASGQKQARDGIGLANTEARLRALHGNSAHLAIHLPVQGGVDVEIRLPYVTKPRPESTPSP